MPRQDGTTTRQMIAAPRGAAYVWPPIPISLPYAINLAIHLDRSDLMVVLPEHLVLLAYAPVPPPVVIDHAAEGRLTERQREAHARIVAFHQRKGGGQSMPDTRGSHAGRAVDLILEELRGRKGIGDCLDQISEDEEVWDELRETLAQIVLKEMP